MIVCVPLLKNVLIVYTLLKIWFVCFTLSKSTTAHNMEYRRLAVYILTRPIYMAWTPLCDYPMD